MNHSSDSRMAKMDEFDIIGAIRETETIATGHGVYVRRYPEKTYGQGKWRKMKGLADIRFSDGSVFEAEIHWFEAHGIGRRDFKIKRIIYEKFRYLH